MECLDKIEEDPQSFTFREPVPWKDLGLLDYPRIIKKPMDLKTVRRNLTQGKYKKFETFYKDVSIIWTNCKGYNIAGSEIYKIAEHMETISRRIVAKNKEDLDIQIESSQKDKKRDRKLRNKGDGSVSDN